MRRAAPWILATPWIAWAVARTAAVDAWLPLATAVLAFTPYAALTSPVPLVAAVVTRSRRLAVVSLLVIGLLAGAVLPRAIRDPVLERGYARFTVVSSNLLLGRADTADLMRLARRERADVVVMLEASPATVRRANVAGLHDDFPYGVTELRDNGTGSAIFSRHPLTKTGDTRALGLAQPAADVRLAGGPTIRVQAVHPLPPVGRGQTAHWRRTLKALPTGGRTARSILAGDFNATLDQVDLRRLLGRGYTDAANALGKGLATTWPVGRARPPITIDHVLASDRLEPVAYGTTEISRSDHRAIMARFAVR